jgi:hypothetical protein
MRQVVPNNQNFRDQLHLHHQVSKRNPDNGVEFSKCRLISTTSRGCYRRWILLYPVAVMFSGCKSYENVARILAADG